MSTDQPLQRLSFEVDGQGRVSALLLTPTRPRALYLLAHGAGAGMEHPFLESVARALARRAVATFRYNFPYTEKRGRRPDRKPVLHAAVGAAAAAAAEALPQVPLYAGGKSMGGRMTSEAQAESPLAGVEGLIFLGFPLHPPNRPGKERAEHLARVEVPMLFLQGTRDDLADLELMIEVADELGQRATVHVLDGANHGFHVLKRSGRTDADVVEELAGAVESWLDAGGVA